MVRTTLLRGETARLETECVCWVLIVKKTGVVRMINYGNSTQSLADESVET